MHLEAELEKHMAAASAGCQSYAKEVAGVSLSMGSQPVQSCPSSAVLNKMSLKFQFSGFALGLAPADRAGEKPGQLCSKRILHLIC